LCMSLHGTPFCAPAINNIAFDLRLSNFQRRALIAAVPAL
jgi:hypothetical protein